MNTTLRRRLDRLQHDREAHASASQAQDPRRRWALLNLYVRACAGEDIGPWRQLLAGLPAGSAGLPAAQPLDDGERRLRTLSLLCRLARGSRAYRALLAVAVKAGLATEKQARWIADSGLLAES